MGSRAGQYFTFTGTGEIAVGVAQVRGPDIPCRKVMFTAHPDNAGVVYVGATTGVTISDGSTDETTGFPRTAGQDTGWLFANNLNEFYFIASQAGQAVGYVYDL